MSLLNPPYRGTDLSFRRSFVIQWLVWGFSVCLFSFYFILCCLEKCIPCLCFPLFFLIPWPIFFSMFQAEKIIFHNTYLVHFPFYCCKSDFVFIIYSARMNPKFSISLSLYAKLFPFEESHQRLSLWAFTIFPQMCC